jgi:ABC-type lipoprotein release transport system permease subunit
MIVQVGTGVLLGAGLLLLVELGITDSAKLAKQLTLNGSALLLAHMIVMMGVCLLACVAPTRRALGIQPIHALSADA